jgi:hypothetical protein
MLEVEIDANNFLKIKETLTRIGIGSWQKKTLWQSCHILHKQGRYFIVHFKELFTLDGREVTWDSEDLDRRNTIAYLLQEWGLLTIKDPKPEHTSGVNPRLVRIIPFAQKNEWNLVEKYKVGRKLAA